MRAIATLFCVVGMVFLLTAVASAAPVPIGNHGFQDATTTITPGGTDSAHPGPWLWKVGNSQRVGSGIFNPPPPDGSAWIANLSAPDNGVILSQDLTALALPNTTYTLTVDATSFPDSQFPMTLTPFLLHANDDSPVGTGPDPNDLFIPSTDPNWSTVNFTWTTDGTEPGTEFLKIAFQVTPNGANPLAGTVFLDDVRLDDGTATPPATTYTWDNSGSGDWNDTTNWAFAGAGLVPNSSGHTAVFGNVIGLEARNVFTDVPITVNKISFENTAGGSYRIGGGPSISLDEDPNSATLPTIQVSGGANEFQAPVELLANTTVTVTGGSLDFNNQVDLNGNVLTLSGTVSLNHSVIDSSGGGSVSSLGTLGTEGITSIGADMTLDGSTLDLDLRDSTGGVTSDQFDVLGSATLEGNITVDVELVGGFSPTSNVTILSTTTGIVNNSLSLVLSGPGAGAFTGVNVVGDNLVLQVGIPGDFDGDGDVDGFDFLKWQVGESPNPFSALDLGDWEANYGTVAPLTASSAAVPEPATAALSLLLAGGGALVLHRRRW